MFDTLNPDRRGFLAAAVKSIAAARLGVAGYVGAGWSRAHPTHPAGTGPGGRKAGIINRIVVSRHVEQGHVQHGNDVLQVTIGEVATAKDHFHAGEMTLRQKAVEPVYHLITQGEDSH